MILELFSTKNILTKDYKDVRNALFFYNNKQFTFNIIFRDKTHRF